MRGRTRLLLPGLGLLTLLVTGHAVTSPPSQAVEPDARPTHAVSLDRATTGAVLSPDGRRAYVTTRGAVVTLDTTNLKQISRFRSGGLPLAPTVSPRGTRLYAADAANGRVLALSTKDGRREWTVTIGGAPRTAVLDRNGVLLYLTDTTRDLVIVLDTQHRQVRAG
ncbi:MAG TPA: hypothetical protein DCQ36_02685, partial [Actinobacteria bacterium]|nr:hypothetical protein [Actinomycetota bacterium]